MVISRACGDTRGPGGMVFAGEYPDGDRDGTGIAGGEERGFWAGEFLGMDAR